MTTARLIVILVVAAEIGCVRSSPREQITSEDSGSILGQVTSSQGGVALKGAFVRLLASDKVSIDSARTDEAGRFIFRSLNPATYQVQVRMIGHRHLNRLIDIKAGIVDTLKMQLMFDTTGLISDCMSPDGRSFGSQFCRR
jgi:hypothetical protein